MPRILFSGFLPSLELKAKPTLSTKSFYELLELNLNSPSMKKLKVLKLWIDISNIYAALEEKVPFDSRGNYSKSTLKTLIANKEELPEYVLDFFSLYESDEERKAKFSYLIAKYFQEEKKKAKGFLRTILDFEHTWRLLMAGYLGKKEEADIAHELQFENLDEEMVYYVLLQKDRGGTFQFPHEYKDLEIALLAASKNPSKELFELTKWRFSFYIQYMQNNPFSLRGIMAYLMALFIVEDYHKLQEERGKELLDNLVEIVNVS